MIAAVEEANDDELFALHDGPPVEGIPRRWERRSAARTKTLSFRSSVIWREISLTC